MAYILSRSRRADKKFQVITPSGKKVYFGAKGYQDYTMHKNPERKRNYISRHSTREKWGKSGLDTAGFWSRWLLWNLPSIDASIKDIQKRFAIKIVKR